MYLVSAKTITMAGMARAAMGLVLGLGFEWSGQASLGSDCPWQETLF